MLPFELIRVRSRHLLKSATNKRLAPNVLVVHENRGVRCRCHVRKNRAIRWILCRVVNLTKHIFTRDAFKGESEFIRGQVTLGTRNGTYTGIFPLVKRNIDKKYFCSRVKMRSLVFKVFLKFHRFK